MSKFVIMVFRCQYTNQRMAPASWSGRGVHRNARASSLTDFQSDGSQTSTTNTENVRKPRFGTKFRGKSEFGRHNYANGNACRSKHQNTKQKLCSTGNRQRPPRCARSAAVLALFCNDFTMHNLKKKTFLFRISRCGERMEAAWSIAGSCRRSEGLT